MNGKQPHRFPCLLLILATTAASPAWAADWLTLPSTFTHDPATGCRVSQFAPVDAPPMNDQSQLIASGYTNYRSSIQVGQSADHYYRVNQWGAPVRPYGEWLFPYRPYSAPYEAWGAPFAGLNLGFGSPHFFGPQFGPGGDFPGGSNGSQGFPGHRFPGYYPGGGVPGQPINPYPTFPGGAHREPPWYDGFHPEYPPLQPRLNDRDFYRRP